MQKKITYQIRLYPVKPEGNGRDRDMKYFLRQDSAARLRQVSHQPDC